MKQFIKIGHRIIDIRDIRRVEASGCWGKLWLWSEREPIILGDGSYENDTRHVSHWVCHFNNLLAALSEHASDCTGPGWKDDDQVRYTLNYIWKDNGTSVKDQTCFNTKCTLNSNNNCDAFIPFEFKNITDKCTSYKANKN